MDYNQEFVYQDVYWLSELTGGSARANWCREQFGNQWEWHWACEYEYNHNLVTETFYFKQEQDLTLFLLRWA